MFYLVFHTTFHPNLTLVHSSSPLTHLDHKYHFLNILYYTQHHDSKWRNSCILKSLHLGYHVGKHHYRLGPSILTDNLDIQGDQSLRHKNHAGYNLVPQDSLLSHSHSLKDVYCCKQTRKFMLTNSRLVKSEGICKRQIQTSLNDDNNFKWVENKSGKRRIP